MIFLSLGAGVQSTVMLMRAIKGDIDRPDHVIFSDTGWEPAHVMTTVAWCKDQCDIAKIPFHIVSAGNIRDDAGKARTADSGAYAGRWAAMPFFVDTGRAVEERIKRQCTSEYKLNPIRKKQRELLGYKKGQRIPPGAAGVMIGISTDESRRAGPSRARWIDNLYPLIDPLKASRADCQKWWDDHYPFIRLRRSSCIGCPNKTDREWLDLALNSPREFADACEFDRDIRRAAGMKGKSFLHRSLKPLSEIDFNADQQSLNLEDDLYCAGGCGL